jgi:hypothetical protein
MTDCQYRYDSSSRFSKKDPHLIKVERRKRSDRQHILRIVLRSSVHHMSSTTTSAADKLSLTGKHVNVAFMTVGGLAPCLSASLAQLVTYWIQALHSKQISGLSFRCYLSGYKGLLTGDSIILPESEWDDIDALNYVGGSPIGNSRVKVRAKMTFMKFYVTRDRRIVN